MSGNNKLRCCICGRSGPDMEPAHTIYLRVLGEPFSKQLYRCRDHGNCALRACDQLPHEGEREELEFFGLGNEPFVAVTIGDDFSDADIQAVAELGTTASEIVCALESWRGGSIDRITEWRDRLLSAADRLDIIIEEARNAN